MARKQIIAISFLAVSLLLAAGATRAEDFSDKTIKLMVGASMRRRFRQRSVGL
jgi:hypothetical protein